MQPNEQTPSTDGPNSVPTEEVSNTSPNEQTPVSSGTEASEIPETTPEVTAPEAPANEVIKPEGAATTEPSVTGATVPTAATIGLPPMTPVSGSELAKKGASKKVKILALIAALVVVLIGGTAAAYFGVVVPNKPENVLKSAVVNTLKEKQISYDGTFDSEAADKSKSGATPAGNLLIKGGTDIDKQATKAEVTVTISGVKVQAEIRYVDQTAYVKLGDLSAIKGFAGAYSPELSQGLSKLENQWIEIDKTLLKEANTDCVLNTKLAVTDQDIQLLSDAYGKTPFATIKSKGSDTVNGKAATKFELALDDNKMADYAKNLDNLSFVKQLKTCSKDAKVDDSSLKDGDTTPLTVWVDKSTKHIVKLASHSTDYDAKQKNLKASGSITLNYGPVTVEKPANAKPLMSLIGEFAPLFGGTNGVRGANSDSLPSLLGL